MICVLPHFALLSCLPCPPALQLAQWGSQRWRLYGPQATVQETRHTISDFSHRYKLLCNMSGIILSIFFPVLHTPNKPVLYRTSPRLVHTHSHTYALHINKCMYTHTLITCTCIELLTELFSLGSVLIRKVAGAKAVLPSCLTSHHPSSDFWRTSTITPLGKDSSSSSSAEYFSTVRYFSMSVGVQGVHIERAW